MVKVADFIIALDHSIISPLWLVWVRAPHGSQVRQVKFYLRVCQVVFPGVLPFSPHLLIGSSRYEQNGGLSLTTVTYTLLYYFHNILCLWTKIHIYLDINIDRWNQANLLAIFLLYFQVCMTLLEPEFILRCGWNQILWTGMQKPIYNEIL